MAESRAYAAWQEKKKAPKKRSAPEASGGSSEKEEAGVQEEVAAAEEEEDEGEKKKKKKKKARLRICAFARVLVATDRARAVPVQKEDKVPKKTAISAETPAGARQPSEKPAEPVASPAAEPAMPSYQRDSEGAVLVDTRPVLRNAPGGNKGNMARARAERTAVQGWD